jgi:hypothetical protein
MSRGGHVGGEDLRAWDPVNRDILRCSFFSSSSSFFLPLFAADQTTRAKLLLLKRWLVSVGFDHAHMVV